MNAARDAYFYIAVSLPARRSSPIVEVEMPKPAAMSKILRYYPVSGGCFG